MKHLYQLLLFTLIVVLCLMLLFTTLAVTRTGSNWFIRWLIKTNDLPIQVQVIEGRLADNIVLRGLRYRDDARVIEIDTIELVWHPAALIEGTVAIEQLLVQTVVYQALPDTGKKDEPLSFVFTLPELRAPSLPVAVRVEKISVLDGVYRPVSGEPASYSMQALLQMDADRLDLQLQQLQFAEQQLRGSMIIDDTLATPVAVNLNWSGQLQESAASGALEMSGAPQRLAINLNTEGALVADLQGELQPALAPYALSLAGAIHGPVIDAILPAGISFAPLNIDLAGNMDELEVSLGSVSALADRESRLNAEISLLLPGRTHDNLAMHIEWQSIPDTNPSQLAVSGIGDFELANNKLILDHTLEGPGTIRISGAVRVDDLDVDLLLAWDELQFPIADNKSATSPYGKLTLNGPLSALALSLQSAYRYAETDTDTAVAYEGTVNTDGNIDLSGDTPIVNLKGAVSVPELEAIQAHVRSMSPLQFDAIANSDSWQLHVNLTTTMHDDSHYLFMLDSVTDLHNSYATVVDWSIKGQQAQRQIVAGSASVAVGNDIIIQHQTSAPYVTTLKATINASQDRPTGIDLLFNWENIDPGPLTGNVFTSEAGEVSITGHSNDMQISASSKLSVQPLGNISLALNSVYKEERLSIQALRLAVLEGEIEGAGNLIIQDALTGELKLRATGLNLAVVNKDMESAINMDAHLLLSQLDQTPRLALAVSRLDGSWRDKPLTGNADIVYTPGQLDIRPLRLSLQDNDIEVNMTRSDTLNGDVVIDLDDLASFSTALSGSISGKLSLVGDRLAPKLDATLTAKNLYYDDWRIGELDSVLDVDLAQGQRSELAVAIRTLRYEDAKFDSVSIKGGGLTERHQLSVEATAEALQLVANIEAGLRQRQWQGKMTGFRVNSKGYGVWQLEQPLTYAWHIDNNSLSINQSCFNSGGASACLQVVADGNENVNAGVVLEKLPLSLANSWLPTPLTLQGSIDGELSYAADSKNQETVIDLQTSNAILGIGYSEDKEQIELSRAVLSSNLSNASRQLELALVAPTYFDLYLKGETVNNEDAPLSGNMKLRLPDIRWLEKLEPMLNGTRGEFDLALNTTGTLQKPQVDGVFKLGNGLISILPLGLKIDSLQGDVHSGDSNGLLQFDTRLASKDKALTVKGDVMLDPEQGYPYRFSVDGNSFPLVNTADIRMDVSPELKLSGDSTLHKVRGLITVPRLNVLVTTLPESAVSVSPDVIIIQSQQADAVHVEDQNSGNVFMKDKLDVDVNVILDPDIRLSGFGVDAGLSGDIRLSRPAGVAQPRAQGQVLVKQGSYTAYGKNLEIQEGRILFAGPIDNPAINVRAFRPGLAVKAGVNVTGSIREPTLTLYSDPVQTESDTLSYIITGRALGDASGGEASLIAKAALSLGARQSSVLTGQIAEMFNLDDVSVGAGSTLESTSLSASKRITRDLTFKTAFNPFDQLWSFLLNYQLTENWSVQSQTGVRQGADIIYSIESNKFKELYRKLFDVLTFAGDPEPDATN